MRECNYGDYNGKPAAVVEPLQEKYIHTPFPNGESCAMVEARIQCFLDDLLRDYNGRHIAVVSHKLPQLALEVLTKGMTWPEPFAHDWRKSGSWQPGWEYVLED